MMPPSSEWIGWTATAVFTGSYLVRRQRTLRRVQMGGAALWMAYGAATAAVPVVAANVLVLCAAGAAEWREARETRRDTPRNVSGNAAA